jgi:type II secretory pathway component GspD/PulD (secretin)
MKKTLIIFILCLIFLSGNVLAFDMETEVTFNLRKGSTLKQAFDKLEKLSNDSITFYYDSDIDLNNSFKMTLQDNYESVLNLVLQLNDLKIKKISNRMFYVYPASKEGEISKDKLLVYQQTPETIKEIKDTLVTLYRGEVEIETNKDENILYVKTDSDNKDGIDKVITKIIENKTRIRVMEKEYQLTYLKPEIAIEKLNQYLSGKVQTLEEEGKEEKTSSPNNENDIILNSVTNEAKNSIILKYDKKYKTSIEQLISLIDTKSSQVEVQVSILEISRDKLKALGIDYDLTNIVTDLVRSDSINYDRIPGSTFVNVVKSYSNVLSSPKIRILDREEGNIKIGQEIPIVTVEKEDEDSEVVPSVEYRHVGIDLLITPHTHNKANEITLDLDLSVDSLGEKEPTPYGDYYKINIKNVDTKIRLSNDKTVVLGGLITNEEREKNTEIPILSDLPLIGKIFQKTERSPKQSEVIMLITPKFVNSSTEESESVKEIRERLNAEFDYDKKLKEANETISRLLRERRESQNEETTN